MMMPSSPPPSSYAFVPLPDRAPRSRKCGRMGRRECPSGGVAMRWLLWVVVFVLGVQGAAGLGTPGSSGVQAEPGAPRASGAWTQAGVQP